MRRQIGVTASPTSAPVVTTRERVVGRELMAVLTVRAACETGSYAFAAKDVLARRYDLKMRRIDAPSIATEMVDVETSADSSDEEQVRNAVRVPPCPTRRHRQLGITPAADGSRPEPAASLMVDDNLRHQASADTRCQLAA